MATNDRGKSAILTLSMPPETVEALDAAAKAGLDVEAARAVLVSRSQGPQVDAAWARARQLGLNGVPAFVGGGYQFSGYQPLAEMERFVDFVQSKS